MPCVARPASSIVTKGASAVRVSASAGPRFCESAELSPASRSRWNSDARLGIGISPVASNAIGTTGNTSGRVESRRYTSTANAHVIGTGGSAYAIQSGTAAPTVNVVCVNPRRSSSDRVTFP